MGWKCVFPSCTVKEDDNPHKLTAFQIPWSAILRIDLEKVAGKARMCEKHFNETDIRDRYFDALNGHILLNVSINLILSRIITPLLQM